MPRTRAFAASVAGLGLVAGAIPAAVAVQGTGPWVPTNWTGVVPGAPVPGEGLPAAAVPAMLTPLPPEINPVINYEAQTTCEDSPKPGAVRLEQIIKATYGNDQYTNIPRDCGKGGTSEHKEGRAIDWMVDVRDDQQRANAEAFLNWLLGPDASGRLYGHALQLGIMYVGWHDRMWRGYGIDRGWQELKGCFAKPDEKYDNSCHRNHIHISLTWAGANGTVDGSAPAQPAPTPGVNELPADPPMPPRPPAPAQPGEDSDQFMAIGSQVGFTSETAGALQPGEVRTIDLAPVPLNATSALVSITTSEAGAKSQLRIGIVGEKKAALAVKVPKTRTKTIMRQVPVSQGALQIQAADKAAVNVRIDVLGYTVDGGNQAAVGTAPAKLDRGRYDVGEVKVVQVRGVGAVPKKAKKVTAVILRVTAKGLGQEGRFAAYPVGGADLGTTSAPIPATGKTSSVVVADIGTDGQVALASSVKAKVRVQVIGYVKK